MANPSKAKGTAFETMLVRWLQERLQDDRIERRALHGSKDMGDIYGIWAHGSTGIIEAKNYKSWGPRDLEVWQAQTIAERGNADADWAVLAPKKYGLGPKSLARLPVYLTFGDAQRLANVSYVINPYSSHVEDTWISVCLEDVCKWIEGPDGA